MNFQSQEWIVNEILNMQKLISEEDNNFDTFALAEKAKKKILNYIKNDPRTSLERGASLEIDPDKVKKYLLTSKGSRSYTIEDLPIFRTFPEEYIVFLQYDFLCYSGWRQAVRFNDNMTLREKYEIYLKDFKENNYAEKIGLTYEIFEDYINTWDLNKEIRKVSL